MKNESPITNVEVKIYDRTLLVTETDTNGIISYTNHVFCELSGYTLKELIGAPHSIIRHPDIPKQVFENLWLTLQKGETWAGIIKNRTKRGNYYWVKATITPITDDTNTITGYRSLSRKTLPEDIERAEALYEQINNGKKASITNLHNSVRTLGLKDVLGRFTNNYGVFYAIISNLSIATLPLYGIDNKFFITATVLNTTLITAGVFYKKNLRHKSIKQLENTLQLFLLGNLSTRNQLIYDNEFYQLHNLFNRNAELIEISSSEIDHSLYKLSIGQFDRITKFSMPGDFDVLRNHLNETVISVKNILSRINKRIETLTESKVNNQDTNDNNDAFEPTGYYKNIFTNLDYLIQSNQNQMRELIKYVHRAENGDFSMHNVDTNPQHNGFISELSTHLNALFRNIEQNLTDISKMAINISSGNLKDPITNIYFGKFGETVDGINAMRQSLSDIIEVMSESINVIHEASLQISNGNMDFAQRTEVQSANLKKNATAMEALLYQVKQTANSASLAHQLVLETSQVASQGGCSVGEVINTMVTIDESSRKVASIISVIDEIAFQTNILSLNAAVEAARAGEQGRGFAVVASEVRSLAQRSTAAAKEIKSLINLSMVNVENGNSKVEDAGKTINEVVSFVNRVTNLMADITLATSEQSVNIDKVNEVIMQINTITQLNNVLASESIEAAVNLEMQSRSLRKIINHYTSNNKDYTDNNVVRTLNDASQAGKFGLF